ncbi:DNA-processing protein DprA [Actinomycetaceae bacterium TAE3-ERU4]|nr:DNA-processing protein DprA [Actinomycetaceae bacterium TAE3-ERU4]
MEACEVFTSLAKLAESSPEINGVIWSSLVEAPSPLAGRLVSQLGGEGALCLLAEVASGRQVCELDGITSDGLVNLYERVLPRALCLNPVKSLDNLEKIGGTILVPQSVGWPRGLSSLGDSQPFALWVRGQIPAGLPISIVGARSCTRYGEVVAQEMALNLSKTGAVIVSGGAYGIDSAAHEGALAGSGKTIAVMAGGIDRLYPLALEQLHSGILERGAVISEVPLGSRPARWRFLARNRIIAALSAVTVVVEAGTRSGALATARRASELGRPLAAVPGPVTSQTSVGTNRLIKDGARLVCDAQEVVALAGEEILSMDLFGKIAPEIIPGIDTAEEDELPISTKRVLEVLPLYGDSSVSSIVRASGLSLQEVLTALGELELCSKAKRSKQNRYSRLKV